MSSVMIRCAIRYVAITVAIGILACAFVTAFRMCNQTEKESSESYYYNKYNRRQVDTALADSIGVLSLDEYVNILDSTQNLKTISLQELCQTFVNGCADQPIPPQSPMELYIWARPIMAESVLRGVQRKDWYRLALILLKFFDSLAAVEPNYTQWFERTPTNGVFGVESIRMMKNGTIFPFSELPPIEKAPSGVSDAMYQEYVQTVYEPCRSKILYQLQYGKPCELLSIPMFCWVGCVMILPVFLA